MSWFNRPTVAYKIVEVEKPRTLPALASEEVRAMLATLPSNPGWQYILERLRLQKAVLEQTLKNKRHEKLEEVYSLQAGIYWAEWLDAEMARLTQKAAAIESDTTDFERDAFQQIDSMLERVTA